MECPHQLIMRYPGQCVVFNLLKASRIKKEQQRGEKGLVYRDDEVDKVSDSWQNEDNDNYLIIRLLFPDGGYPWLVAHHGIFEAFKAPLYVPICESKDSSVTIVLRDFANRDIQKEGDKRKSHCIVRKFILTFGSNVEAEAFRSLHNGMLLEHKESKNKVLLETKNGAGDDKLFTSSSSATQAANDVDHNKEEGAAGLHRATKKRKRPSQNGKEEDKLKVQKLVKERMDDLEKGDDYSLLDSLMPNTQNPFEDYDESEF